MDLMFSLAQSNEFYEIHRFRFVIWITEGEVVDRPIKKETVRDNFYPTRCFQNKNGTPLSEYDLFIGGYIL